MSKYSLINLLDKLFISVAIFLTIYAWINFYTRSLWASFLLSLIFSFACIYLLNYFLSKKKEKINLNKSQIDNINKTYLAFRLLTKEKQVKFFCEILQNFSAKSLNDVLIYVCENQKKAIYFATEIPVLTESDFLNIIQKTQHLNVDEIEIVCARFDIFNTRILKNKKYILTNKESLFKNYFEKFKTTPNLDNIASETNKTKFWVLLNNFFMPHKAKSYFLCGLVLVFSSIILPYHIYYIIVGSMLLMFSIICKLKKLISY